VRHTHDVIDAIRDLNLTMEMIWATSNQFAFSGKESDLDNYGASVRRAKIDEAEIRALTADNPVQGDQLLGARALIEESIQRADVIIESRRRQGKEAAPSFIHAGGNEQIKNEFQAKVGEMQREESRLLALRRAENEIDLSQAKWIVILGTVAGILVTAIAAWTVLAENARRQVSEDALQKSEEKLRVLLDGIYDYAIFMLDPEGCVASWNAGAERIKGYLSREIIGHNFSCFYRPEDIRQGKPEGALRSATEHGRHEEVAIHVRKDGSEFLASVILTPLRNAAGGLLGFSEIFHDLTEHRRSEARYRGLLEAAPDGMVVANQTGEIVLLNSQAERMFGYHRDELLGQNVKNIIPEGFAERLIADAHRATLGIPAQEIGSGIELSGRCKDGTRFPIEIMLSPLESADGVLITAAIRDISERLRLAQQLHQCQKMEALGQLTGGIVHDFNNLLTVVIGNLGLLGPLVQGNEEALKRVRTAQKAAARGVDITRRLLVFSNNDVWMPAFVSLGDSIQNVIEMASRALGANITITTHLDLSLPQVYVDAASLESALLNLAVNARDAMPEGGSILISSLPLDLVGHHPLVTAGGLKMGHYVCVKVTDTGQGMSPKTLDRACEPFFTTKPRDKGTGLGLAMVYGLMKRSDGAVWIDSELGHGTTVSLYFPVREDTPHLVAKETIMAISPRLDSAAPVVDDKQNPH